MYYQDIKRQPGVILSSRSELAYALQFEAGRFDNCLDSMVRLFILKPRHLVLTLREQAMIQSAKNESPYLNPYLGGIGIGVILFAVFFLAGKGLGASGALTRLLTFTMDSIAPTYLSEIDYLYNYATAESGPLYHWLFFMFIGILIGGLFAGIRGNRIRTEIYKGPRTTQQRRVVTAFVGGVLVALGARLAGGCTSGLALTGASLLGVSGWVFFLSVFAAGLITAFVVQKEWL